MTALCKLQALVSSILPLWEKNANKKSMEIWSARSFITLSYSQESDVTEQPTSAVTPVTTPVFMLSLQRLGQ